MLQRNVKEAKDVKSMPVQKRVIPFQALAPNALSKINSYLILRDNINWRQTNLFFNMAYRLIPSYSQYKSFIIDYSNWSLAIFFE